MTPLDKFLEFHERTLIVACRGSDFDEERLVVMAWSYVGAMNEEDSATTSDSSSIIDCNCPFANAPVPSAESGEEIVSQVRPKPALTSSNQIRQRRSSTAGTMSCLNSSLADHITDCFWFVVQLFPLEYHRSSIKESYSSCESISSIKCHA